MSGKITDNLGRSSGLVKAASAGRMGTVDWDTTIKTSGFTAANGTGYFCNTTSAGFTVAFPAASVGDIISIADYAGTFGSKSLAVSPNGSDKINGVNGAAVLTTNGQSVTFVYADSTKGWLIVQDSTETVTGTTNLLATGGTITTCGDYKIHTFTGPGTFGVVQLSPTPSDNNADYLVVAGGGSGGSKPGTSNNEGGGGGGGYRESPGTATGSYSVSPLGTSPAAAITLSTSPGSYPIVVGAGGAAKAPCAAAYPGNTSSFSPISSAGGGRGGYCGCPTSGVGGPGGSGGGARGGGSLNTAGGTGNTPPVTPPQGQPGGTSPPGYPDQGGGGGGGATEAGANATPSPTAAGGGRGGAGATSSITGSPVARSGGGGTGCGAASPCGSGTAGNRSGPTSNAAANRGGGSGGALSGGTSGSGGSGVVIIRYKYQ